MKPVKGLFMDTRPQEQPEGTNPFGKNGIQYDLSGSLFNEPGFRQIQAVAPYQVNGIIETDTKPIIFSTNNTNSAIGYFNPDTELYEPVYDDRTWTITGLLGFSTTNYIRGQAQRNYKGDLVCAFSDKSTWPMYANMDHPELLKSINDFRLFAYFSPPDIDVEMVSGGIVPAGAYYVAVGYERNDGTSTQYSMVSSVTIVTPGNIGTTADKALQITITNADTTYDFIRIAIISKINGVTTAVELTDYLPISSGTIQLDYTGEQLSTDIDVATVLTPPALYNQVQNIGQLNDYLYIGDLQEEPDLDDMQPYALLTHLEWVSQIQKATAPSTDLLSGKQRGFMHQEVYAFYIRYRKVRGGMTKWFVCPGVAPRLQDLVQSGETTDAVQKFKLEDCIPYFDPIAGTGGCGGWTNKTETYPDTPQFDASAIGGENLRGAAVRHYKMPSLLFTQQNLYSSNQNFGITDLDLLGIRAVSVKIPDKYQGVINGYEIGYAVRNVVNRTMVGQAALLHGVGRLGDEGQDSSQVAIYPTGGNFTTSIFGGALSGPSNAPNFLQDVRTNTFRIHPFDLLYFKPAITPTYISGLWKMRRENLADPSNFVEDGQLTGQGVNSGPIEYIIDYTTGNKVKPLQSGNLYQKITSSFYVPNNVDVGKFINASAETAFAGYLAGKGWTDIQGSNGTGGGVDNNVGVETVHNYSSGNEILKYEESYMANLVTLKEDIYQSFYSQPLASAGGALDIGDISTLWGGDTFVCAYSYHTFGRWDSLDHYGTPTNCVKIVRRIVCESTANIALRYDIPGNQYSLAWPKAPLIKDDITNYLTLFDRSQDPNQFGYTKDFNAINDLIDSTTWNPFTEYIYSHPYRIHRGGKASRQTRPRSWRTFLTLDYYEVQKNMGRMKNLEGMDDKLIIHMENAMFLTQDKVKLETGSMSVTLGAGDIFQFEPQEAISSKLGYAGTQHDLACVRTPFGYVFVDAKQGEMYIYKGKLSLMNSGVNTFLRNALKVAANNPYIGNGITIGWDQKYKRVILTVKNKVLASGSAPKVFADTDAFWNNLAVGDIVLYNNRLIQYMGVNTSSYSCPPDPVIHVTTWQPVDTYCLQANTINDILDVVDSSGANVISQGTNSGLLKWNSPTLVNFTYDNLGTLTYTGTAPLQSTLNYRLNGFTECLSHAQFSIQLLKNGAPIASTAIASGNTLLPWAWNGTVDSVINMGDTIQIQFKYLGTSNDSSVALLVQMNSQQVGYSTLGITAVQPTAYVGFQGYKNRIRLIDGVADGYEEPNDQNGLGIYFPPVQNLVACPTTPPVIDWVGGLGECLKATSEPTCDLSGGYSYDPVAQTCVKTLTVPATPPSGGVGTAGIAAKEQNIQWNNGGAIIFTPGFPTNGSGTIDVALTTAHLWVNGNIPYDFATRNLIDGRMNAAGIWVQGGDTGPTWTPTNEYIGFSRKVTVPFQKTIYVGMSADNDFKFLLNGTVLVDTSSASGNILGGPNFGKWNIYPITLNAGDNYIEMYARNVDSVAGFAAEIYDMTKAQLIAAATVSDLNIIFSTRDVVGQPFDLGTTVGYSCPAGYSLDNTGGFYSCKQILTEAPTSTPSTYNTGVIHYTTRCRRTNGILDGYCELNTSDGTGLGPLIPDTVDQSCIQSPITAGEAISLAGTIDLLCNDNGCSDTADMSVQLTFPVPITYRMSLLIGVVYLGAGITPVAVGYQIMPSNIPPSPAVASPDYAAPIIPFSIDIEPGTTSINISGHILQKGLTTAGNVWLCNNCQRPVTDLYVSVDASTVQDPLNTYTADFTTSTPGITLHNS